MLSGRFGKVTGPTRRCGADRERSCVKLENPSAFLGVLATLVWMHGVNAKCRAKHHKLSVLLVYLYH
jgi:hypothetical protein